MVKLAVGDSNYCWLSKFNCFQSGTSKIRLLPIGTPHKSSVSVKTCSLGFWSAFGNLRTTCFVLFLHGNSCLEITKRDLIAFNLIRGNATDDIELNGEKDLSLPQMVGGHMTCYDCRNILLKIRGPFLWHPCATVKFLDSCLVGTF